MDDAFPRGPFPAEREARAIKARVHRYYDAATEDYLKYYQTGRHHHMHFGFDRGLPAGGNPTEHLVRYLAGIGGLRHGERLLDAGCGVGGSSIYLAGEMGIDCTGITLVESQARLARHFAARRRAPARFVVNDFHFPAFKAGAFDGVWAIESFDHAVDKRAWVAAMARLLRPGGRLLIADGFRGASPGDGAAERAYAGFLAGWAVPGLCAGSELDGYAAGAGLERLHSEDITADVLPHARAIFRFGLLFLPLRWMLARFGLTGPEKLGNAYATFYQYRALRMGLWEYRVHAYRKPGPDRQGLPARAEG